MTMVLNVPAGNQAWTWLFVLMIDDINASRTELSKYLDDTTVAECVDKKEVSCIQSHVEELIAKSNQNKFHLITFVNLIQDKRGNLMSLGLRQRNL